MRELWCVRNGAKGWTVGVGRKSSESEWKRVRAKSRKWRTKMSENSQAWRWENNGKTSSWIFVLIKNSFLNCLNWENVVLGCGIGGVDVVFLVCEDYATIFNFIIRKFHWKIKRRKSSKSMYAYICSSE